jgi:SAM-dependent methyltransferase
MVILDAATKDSWDDHWAQFGGAAELGPTPRYRRRLIRSLFDFPPPGQSVRFLEIGSGTGEFAQEFCQSFPAARYLGVELSRTGVEISRKRVPSAQFVQQDLLKDYESVEVEYKATHALCSEVLEHLDEPAVLLRHARSYCAPGCRLIVTVPGGPMNAFYEHIGHRRHYKPSELASLLNSSGFQVEAAFGAGFPFFNLFRLLLTIRGPRFVSDVSGPPSVWVHLASQIFELLFRLNSSRWGWQTLAVARLSDPGS